MSLPRARLGDLNAIPTAFTAAAVDPLQWANAMETIASATGSHGAALIPLQGRNVHIPCSESIADLMDAYVRDGWFQYDPRDSGIPQLLKVNVTSDLYFTSPEQMGRSAYYQDFLRRYHATWFAGVKVDAGGDIWCLALQRPWEAGPFSAEELQRLAALSPLLGGPATLAIALENAKAASALAAFDSMAMAAVMLNRRAEIMKANAAFERLLGTGISIIDRRLQSISREQTARLDRSLHALWDGRQGKSVGPPIVLPRLRELARPMVAYPMLLPPITSDWLGGCHALVIIQDLDQGRGGDTDMLRAVFGLTPAEARLAASLVEGNDLASITKALGITYETGRNQLKSVFIKVGVARQGELIAVVKRLLPPLRDC